MCRNTIQSGSATDAAARRELVKTGDRSTALAAGIVVYFPRPELLKPLVLALIGQVDVLYLFCNSPLPTEALSELLHQPEGRLCTLGNERNIGLGAAYNQIVEAAMSRGIDRILLFDQDSSPAPGLAVELCSRMQQLIDAGERPAVVGPSPISREGTAYKTPRMVGAAEANARGTIMPVAFVISSGSLIQGSAFREVGPFRDDFFIDSIDVEWCFRARSRGYTCWMAADVPMEHRLGAGVVRIPAVNVRLVRQPPLRVYTFVRNQLALFRLAHVPRGWKTRTAVLLIVHSIGQPVIAADRLGMLRSVARGWRDGLRGRLGPP